MPENLYKRIVFTADENNESLSQTINDLIHKGFQYQPERAHVSGIYEHYQQLITQINAIVKSLAVDILKFTQLDFVTLWDKVVNKHELLSKQEISIQYHR